MNNKIMLNSISSLCLQMVTCVVGLIVPRLVLAAFGSEVNGTIQSISQLLNYIVLLEAGVGGVVRVSLYHGLVEKDYNIINGTLGIATCFFRRISYIFIIYLFGLALLFPILFDNSFSYGYIFTLVIILGLSTVIQYFVGITYQLFLNADQKSYIFNFIQIFLVIMNAIITYYLIVHDANIHVIKFVSSIIFVIRPLSLMLYVKCKYKLIIMKGEADTKALQQKWEAFAQHIAYFVYGNTDMVILSLFTDMKTVSVYAVYNLIVSSLRNLIESLSTGFTPAIGKSLAKKDDGVTTYLVNKYESICFFCVNVAFTICAFMIVPFVSLYTKGVHDTNYIQYNFGYLLSLSASLILLRNLYHNILYSAGHYRQTRTSAYIELVLNIVLSISLVSKYGLCGVMIGTIVSTIYKLLYCIYYLKDNVLYRLPSIFWKRLSVNLLALTCNVLLYYILQDYIRYGDFIEWTISALITSLVVMAVIIIINGVFYYSEFIKMIKGIKTKKY